jgi:hypothetical protein
MHQNETFQNEHFYLNIVLITVVKKLYSKFFNKFEVSYLILKRIKYIKSVLQPINIFHQTFINSYEILYSM